MAEKYFMQYLRIIRRNYSTLSVILMNKAKVMMTNRLSRTPTVPMMMLMISSAKSRMLGRYRNASSSFDEDVVELFQTSLGNDAFSIADKISLPQQLID